VLLLGESITWQSSPGSSDPRRGRDRLRRGALPAARARCGAFAVNVTLRRAEPRDADFLRRADDGRGRRPVHVRHRPRDREAVLDEIERSQAEPEEFGRFVIEVDGQPAA
jgi:hypothetical protein